MFIEYGGVELEIVQTNGIYRDAVYTPDGQTFLYYRWLIDVWGVLNNSATSYQFQEQKDVNPTAVKGESPYQTDNALVRALRRPRQKLELREEGAVNALLIFDPESKCDAKGGPFPKLFHVRKINGVKTILVHFAVMTYQTQNVEDGKPLLLSHRWEMTEDTDENHFPTRDVTGYAIFDQGALLGHRIGEGGLAVDDPLTVDQMRRQLFHPIPKPWRRTHIRVKVDSDGNTLRYSFTDHLDPIHWGRINATRVKAYHTSQAMVPSRGENAAKYLIQEMVPGVMGGINSLRGFGGAAGGIAAQAGGVGRTILRGIPLEVEHVNVQVWGDYDSSRVSLLGMATGIGIGRLNYYATRQAFVPHHEMRIMRELTGKYVEFDMTMSVGVWGQVFTTGIDLFKSGGWKAFPLEPDVSEVVKRRTDNQTLLTNAYGAAASYSPPVFGTRGGSRAGGEKIMQLLVTQALESPGTIPNPEPPKNKFYEKRNVKGE